MVWNQSKDLISGTLEDLCWTPEQVESSLDKAFHYVTGEAQRAIHWYLSKKRPKRTGARLLRIAAIVTTTAAGLIPLLAEIYGSEGKPSVSPAWASVALILAAAFVGLDRFFGFSSAWMRFLTTEVQIRNALQAFQLDWETQKAAWKGAAPTNEQVQDMLGRCKVFLTQVNAFLENEIATWVQEFQFSLRQIDEAVKARAEARNLGGANIIITNGDQCVDGWELSIDGAARRRYTGKTAALRGLVPGIHTIRTDGTIHGRAVQAERTVTIPPGDVARVELEVT